MGVQARHRPLYAKYAFTVHDTSTGLLQSRFQKATGAAMSIAIGEHSEGGSLAPMKEGTRVSFSNVKFEHGVTDDMGFHNWCLELCNMMAHLPEGSGVDSPDQLRNLAIRQLKRSRNVLFTLSLYNCQPTNYVPLDSDNTSNDIQVEELEVAYEWFDKELG